MTVRLAAVGVALYSAVLWLAVVATVWPSVSQVPLLGALATGARAGLESTSLVAGIPVFTDPRGEWSDWIPEAVCPEVTGRRAGGERVTLYTSDCPPVGFQWTHDAFDELMQYTTRHVDTSSLLEPGTEPPEQFPEAVRRYVALGDYFCHSPLVAPPDLESASMRWTEHVRHYRTGELAEQTLVCRWLCNEPGSYRPKCQMTPMKLRGGQPPAREGP